jgi:hypothetical protein
MKIKTNELTRAALDWAVAQCEGVDVELISARMITERRRLSFTPEEMASLAAPKPYLVIPGVGNAAYSTDWAQGGPIIERAGITVTKTAHGFWESYKRPASEYECYQINQHPLIAAMRCYVASKLGDEIDVPEELCPPTA